VIKVSIFFNSLRGLHCLDYLSRKKNIKIISVIVAKKFLDSSILKKIKQKNFSYKIINKKKLEQAVKKDKGKVDMNLYCGFPYIVKNNLYNYPKLGSLNLHGGKLPQYRGGSALNWQIIKGEKKIGLSVIKMTKRVDAGPIVTETTFDIKKNYDIAKVKAISNKIFPKLLYEAILKIKLKKKLKKQNSKFVRYFKQRKAEDGLIKWNEMTALQINNFVRALTKPYPGAYLTYGEKKISIFKCKIVKKKLNLKKPGHFKIINKDVYVRTKRHYIKFDKKFTGLKNSGEFGQNLSQLPSHKLFSIKTEKLSKKQISDICKLKMVYWKYNYNSQINWFKNNIKKSDLHNCLFLGDNLVGYTCLRRGKIFSFNNKYNFLLFDTMCIGEDFRGKSYGKILMQYNNFIIKKENLTSFLICRSNVINFYEKTGWKKLQSNFDFDFRKNTKDKTLMVFNKSKTIKDYKRKLFFRF